MITDKQAAVLRACEAFGVPTGRWAGLDELLRLRLIEAHSNSSWGEWSTSYSLSNAGYRALAAFDAAHLTVTADDLRRLYETVLRDSGDGSEELHGTLTRIAKALGIEQDEGEDI